MPFHLRPLDLSTLDALEVDSYALFVAQDERPLWGLGGVIDWRLAGGLSRFLTSSVLAGSRDESFLTPTLGMLPGSRIFAFGVGPPGQLSGESFLRIAERSAIALANAGVERIAVGLPEKPPLHVAARALRQAFQPLAEADVYVLGPIEDLERALLGATGS